MLHEYLKLNRNLLCGLAASLAASAAVAQLLSGQEDYLNTTYTTAADYAVFFSVFAGLFYMDNRRRYRLASGRTDTASLRRDLKKLIASLGVAEAVYTVFRWVFQYYFLQAGHDPYLASIMSQCLSAAIYMAVVNLNVKITRLFKYGG